MTIMKLYIIQIIQISLFLDNSAIEDAPDSLFQDFKRRFLSSTTFSPLALPFDHNEHHTLPLCERVPVIVNDNEPSSIIAYALR